MKKYKFSKEHRRKLSESHKGKPWTDVQRNSYTKEVRELMTRKATYGYRKRIQKLFSQNGRQQIIYLNREYSHNELLLCMVQTMLDKGYRVVNLNLGFLPDAIAFKDNKVVFLEAETKCGSANYNKYKDIGGIDEIIWNVVGEYRKAQK